MNTCQTVRPLFYSRSQAFHEFGKREESLFFSGSLKCSSGLLDMSSILYPLCGEKDHKQNTDPCPCCTHKSKINSVVLWQGFLCKNKCTILLNPIRDSQTSRMSNCGKWHTLREKVAKRKQPDSDGTDSLTVFQAVLPSLESVLIIINKNQGC